MGYHLNCLAELVFMAGPKPMLADFGIHHILESCETYFLGTSAILTQLELATFEGF